MKAETNSGIFFTKGCGPALDPPPPGLLCAQLKTTQFLRRPLHDINLQCRGTST